MTYLLKCVLWGWGWGAGEHLQGASIIISENVEKRGIEARVGVRRNKMKGLKEGIPKNVTGK